MKLQDFDFRIWDKHHKGCGNKDCKCQTKYVYGEEAKTRLSEFKEDCEIELFTGLYDKKGKKVYENDIVKVKSLYDYFLAKISIHKEGTFYFEGKKCEDIERRYFLMQIYRYGYQNIRSLNSKLAFKAKLDNDDINFIKILKEANILHALNEIYTTKEVKKIAKD